MGKHETIPEYLDTVRAQIRWKRAWPAVTAELAGHLEDQRQALMQEGTPPEEAERLAVQDMGDPEALGAELDRIHRPRPQWGLLGLTLALACTGAFLRVSLTAGWRGAVCPERTVLALVLGTACLLGLYFWDLAPLARHGRAVYAGALAAGLLCLRYGPAVNHASYYTRYIILFYPVVYALWLYSWRGRGWRGLLAALAGGVPLSLVCLSAPYLTGLCILLLSGLILLTWAIFRDWFALPRRWALGLVWGIAGGIGGGLVLAVFWKGFARTRLLLAFHPELDPLNRGYQGMSARRVLAASRWLGPGAEDFGSLSLERVLPAAAADFLPASMVYQLGWLPYLLLLGALAVLAVWVLVRCGGQKNGGLLPLAAGLTLGLQILMSAVLNLGVTLLSAGLPLLTGNLCTVVNMALMGLALSAFRGDAVPWGPPARTAEGGRTLSGKDCLPMVQIKR